jgi:CBS domain-containing protein
MMTPDPITIEPSATVREAARIIARKKHNRLPVTEHGRLVGVVTRVDVLDALTSDEED